jgi:formate dehydrogenase subunit delta
MKAEKLIRMANQIAAFFRPYPEEQAVKGIHDHLWAFWTPGMRQSLLDQASRDHGQLDPLVKKALVAFKAGESPTEREIAGPEEVGELGSDAG